MSLQYHDARQEPLAELSRFRGEFYSCLTVRSDALFELADAVLCGDGPVRSLAEPSLVGEHRRGHGGFYAALAQGRIDADRMRRALASVPLPRSADGRLVLAADVLWWHRHTGHRMLLSAHNGHIGYLSTHPDTYPRTQGAVLRGRLGRDYVAIGFSFAAGSFLTKDTSLEGDWNPLTVPAARAGMNEHTLDRVRYRDFYLDLRTAPAAARAWLDRARPVYDAGSTFTPDPLPTLALGRAYDILIHLHRVRAADKLAPPPYEPAG
ncbi:erythromycin esterase family protein [Streptomyces sp. TLI_105]|uniref:erythromycin esterase family protein n=1 Tax=Streptomyces sp. TLI_105 TaxID=1881019 RepID=UPI00089C5A0E|nr:erythromycin esterase family protein [Streptomyces sp. TLI_105]SEE24583.1 DDE superfamily endonuclease [Streptomyces sp. TLI_105]